MIFLHKRTLSLAGLLLFSVNTFALDQIIRPYQSVRSAGMGGVRMATGLYDENFFNNPARVTANPRSRFTILQLMPAEITANTISAASSLAGGTDPIKAAANSAGKNIHDRFQLILPAYYHAAIENRKTALAVGLIASVQMDADLRQSYQTNFSGIADIGPAVTVGRKFLQNDALSVGITGHLLYRVSFTPNYSLIDYVRGTSLSLSTLGGEGAMVDFDIGGTYRITQFGEFKLDGALAIQNIMGGAFNLGFAPLKLTSQPPAQPRSVGVGVALVRPMWGVFSDTSFAIDVTDILNNGSGSLFRTLHLGGETHWRSIALRLGFNQGYWTAGLGLDVRYFTFNFATYGEELGLNAGQLEDRRYGLELGFHI